MPLINEQFFASKDIKVFPCSYRNSYLIEGGDFHGQSYTFDPEARLNTEYNYLSISGKSGGHDSYIINYNSTTKLLKCVIGGYYFEIANFTPDLLKETNQETGETTVKKLYIKTRKVELKKHTDSKYGEVQVDSDRSTYVLDSWDSNSSSALDYKTTDNDVYYFTGIKCSNHEELNSTGILEVVKYTDAGAIINNEAFLPVFYHGAGKNAISTNYSHIVEGELLTRNNQASGDNSFAIGEYTKADGVGSFASGNGTIATGDYSQAIGSGTESAGNYSFANGWDTIAAGAASHAEGNGTEALGNTSHAEGNATVASGDEAHAEGESTIASGYASHAEGDSTIASGVGAHAEGYETTASGEASHSAGRQTHANGDYSFAGGQETIANKEGDFVIGLGTKTAEEGMLYQTVVGHYNEVEQGQFIVGTGSTDSDRKNSLVVNNNEINIKDTLKITTNADESIAEITKEEISLNCDEVNITTGEFNVSSLSTTIEATETDLDLSAENNININSKNKLSLLNNLTTGLIADSNKLEIANPTLLNFKIGNISKLTVGNTETNLNNSITTVRILNDVNSKFRIINSSNQPKFTVANTKTDIDNDSIQLSTKSNSGGVIGINWENSAVRFGKAEFRANNGITLVGPTELAGSLDVLGQLKVQDDLQFKVATVSSIDSSIIETKKNPLKIKAAQKSLTLESNAGINILSIGNSTKQTTGDIIINTEQTIASNNKITSTWKFNATDGSLKLPGKLLIEKINVGTNAKSVDIFETKLEKSTNNYNSSKIRVNNNAANSDLEIATDANKINPNSNPYQPIYVRQYSNNFSALRNQITLLDENGYTRLKSVFATHFQVNHASKNNTAVQIFNTDSDTAHSEGMLKVGSTGRSGKYVGLFSDGSIEAESITLKGSMTAKDFTATSDQRLKENIIPFNSTNSILNLPIYTFNFKEDKEKHIGCLAQDLQKLYPELVKTDKDGYLSIKESKLVYLLLDEIKKLENRISQLEEK